MPKIHDQQQQQQKRGPGRPRNTTPRAFRIVSLGLTPSLVDALDNVTSNRSGYIERLLRKQPAIADRLAAAQNEDAHERP